MQVNISSGRQYTAKVYARNYGPNRSPPSNSVTFTFSSTGRLISGQKKRHIRFVCLLERERDLSVGGIVGIVVGCVAAIVIAVIVVIFVVKKKHCKDKVRSV